MCNNIRGDFEISIRLHADMYIATSHLLAATPFGMRATSHIGTARLTSKFRALLLVLIFHVHPTMFP